MSMRGMGSATRTAKQGRTAEHCAKSGAVLKQAATAGLQASGSAKAQAQKAANAARHAATCASDGAVYLEIGIRHQSVHPRTDQAQPHQKRENSWINKTLFGGESPAKELFSDLQLPITQALPY